LKFVIYKVTISPHSFTTIFLCRADNQVYPEQWQLVHQWSENLLQKLATLKGLSQGECRK